MKTWRPLEVPVSKSNSIFNSLKRRKQPQEDKLLLPPDCDWNRTWNAIWEEISEFPPNALKIKTLTTLARTDTQYIYYYQQSMCAQEKERSHGNSGEQAEEELTCLHHRCRSGASLLFLWPWQRSQGWLTQWPDVSKILVLCTIHHDFFF